MNNHRTGLHKEISSIFNGVPIPKNDGAQQSQSPSAPKQPVYPPPEPPTRTYGNIPTQSIQQPDLPPPKTSVSEQPKVDFAEKTSQPSRWQQTFEQIKGRLLASKPGVDPKRHKVMLILVPVLFIVLIIVFSQFLFAPVRGIRKPQVPASANAAAADKVDWQIPDPYPLMLRDPMQLASVSSAQNGGEEEIDRPVVKGIIYSEDGSSAVIGNQIVREGEKILGATITKINPDSVEFEMKDKKWIQKVQ